MDYIVTKDTNTDELQHYGVRGMRWGVRRAQKKYSKATTQEGRDKAIASLEKHRTKSEKKIKKLQKKQNKLIKKEEKAVYKQDPKAAKLRTRAAKLEQYANNNAYRAEKHHRKAYGFFTSQKRSQKHLQKADWYANRANYQRLRAAKLSGQADQLKAKSDRAKLYLANNKRMIETFESGIKDIDKTLVAAGRRYVND